MKKLLFALILLSALTAQAGDVHYRRIDNPVYQFRGTELFEVTSVELSDTATVVNMRVDYTQGLWFRVEDNSILRDDQGRIYPIRALDSNCGIRLNQHYFHQTGGEVIIRKIYPPLPADVKWIDDTFPDDEGYGTYGIRLDTTPAPAVEVKTERLPAIDYKFGIATIRGHVMDYRPGMVKGVLLFPSEYNGVMLSDTVSTAIDAQGDFVFHVPVTHITPMHISVTVAHGAHLRTSLLYAAPDEETEVYLNLRAIKETRMFFMPTGMNAPTAYVTRGPLADVATELNQYDVFSGRNGYTYTPSEARQNADSITPNDVFNFALRKIEESEKQPMMGHDAHTYERVDRSHRFSPVAEEIIGKDRRLRAITMFDTNSQQLLFSAGAYDSLFFEKRKEKHAQWKKANETAILDLYQQQLGDPQQLLCPSFYNMLNQISQNVLYPDYIDHEMRTMSLNRQLNDFMPFDKIQQEQNVGSMPEAYQQWLRYRNEQVNRQVADDQMQAEAHFRKDLPKVSDDKLFDALCQRYKGRTVHMIVWNPERHDPWQHRFFTEIVKPMQQHLADKDIVWVTLAPAQLGEAYWRHEMSAISGDHYQVTPEQANALLVQIHNQPRDYAHVIISPDGEQRFREPFWLDITFYQWTLNFISKGRKVKK